jgi:hypothetical protein
MIEKEPQQVDTNIPHRRRGSAFDTLANLFRNVKELVFQNNIIIRNRPGEAAAANVESVFEILANKPAAKGKLNYFFFGRRGIADQQGDTKRNVNYQEITANVDTTQPDSVGNGNININLAIDGVRDGGGMGIIYGGAITSGRTGTRAYMSGAGDGSTEDFGGAQMLFINTSNGSFIGIAVDKEGIQMYGLPDNPTGLEAGTIWNDGGTLKIV